MLVFKFQVWKNVKSLMKKKFNIKVRALDMRMVYNNKTPELNTRLKLTLKEPLFTPHTLCLIWSSPGLKLPFVGFLMV